MRAGEWRHGDGGAGISGAGLGTFGPPGPPPWKGHVASCAVIVPVRRQSASAGLQQPEAEPDELERWSRSRQKDWRRATLRLALAPLQVGSRCTVVRPRELCGSVMISACVDR